MKNWKLLRSGIAGIAIIAGTGIAANAQDRRHDHEPQNRPAQQESTQRQSTPQNRTDYHARTQNTQNSGQQAQQRDRSRGQQQDRSAQDQQRRAEAQARWQSQQQQQQRNTSDDQRRAQEQQRWQAQQQQRNNSSPQRNVELERQRAEEQRRLAESNRTNQDQRWRDDRNRQNQGGFDRNRQNPGGFDRSRMDQVQRQRFEQERLENERRWQTVERYRQSRRQVYSNFGFNRYRVYRNGSYFLTDNNGMGMLQQALNYGYEQGIRAGQQDRYEGRGFDFQDASDFRSGMYGYSGSYVDSSEYGYYFREGFQRGYEDGYNDRYEYGSYSDGRYSILGTILRGILRFDGY